jgi:hypothetical protein
LCFEVSKTSGGIHNLIMQSGVVMGQCASGKGARGGGSLVPSPSSAQQPLSPREKFSPMAGYSNFSSLGF